VDKGMSLCGRGERVEGWDGGGGQCYEMPRQVCSLDEDVRLFGSLGSGDGGESIGGISRVQVALNTWRDLRK
jgi:hypothetical protein